MKLKMPDECYSNLQEKYIAYFESNPSIHVYYYRPAVIKLLPNALKNKCALDIGCCSGWYTEYLIHQGCTVFAIDSNQYFVDYTRRRVQEKATVLCLDLNKNLPFDDHAFDLILAPLVIHYIENWNRLFLHLARILKKDGILILSIPHPAMSFYQYKLDNYFKKQVIKFNLEDLGAMTYYHRSLHALFESIFRAGLRVITIAEPSPLPKFKNVDFEMYQLITSQPFTLFLKVTK